MDAATTETERHDSNLCTGALSCLCRHPDTMTARYIYAVIFLLATAFAWVLRESPKAFFQRQRTIGCHGDRVCLATEGVLIICMSLSLFHMIMFFTTVCTKSKHDLRNSWHSQWWPAKILLLVGCFWICSIASSSVLELYGKAAHFGAGLFLIIQLISAMRYITRMNSRWCGPNFDNHRCKVILFSTLAYGASMVGMILLVDRYIGDCPVNTALIVCTFGLVYFMYAMSLLTKANKGFFMEPALMGAYIVFMCFLAIKSEPERNGCYKKEKSGSGANWLTIGSFVAELISVAVAAFSTGTDYRYIQLWNLIVSGNDVPYGYGFFHFVFGIAYMNLAMLLLGWEPRHPSQKWSMDVSWISTLVHVIIGALAVISMVAIIIARRYGIGWLHQLLGKIFGIGGQQQPPVDESRQPEEIKMGNMVPPQDQSLVTQRDEGRTETGNNGAPPPPAQDQPRFVTEREGTHTTDRDDQPPQGPSIRHTPLVTLIRWSMAVVLFVVEVISRVLARFYGIDWIQQLLGRIFGIGGQQLADGSNATELRRTSTDNRPRQEPSRSVDLVVRERTDEGAIRDTEPVGSVQSGDDDHHHDAPPPSSCSSTTAGGPVVLRRSDEPREPPPEDVIGRQYGEITEHWLS